MLAENAERRCQVEMLWSYLVIATFVNRGWYYLVSINKRTEGSHGKGWLGVSELHWSTYRPRPAGEAAWLISGDLSHNSCIVSTHTNTILWTSTNTISRTIPNTISRTITNTISRTITNTISGTITNTNCQKILKPATAEFFLAPLMSTWVAIHQLRRNKQENKYN